MLSSLSYLIYGESCDKPKRLLNDTSCLYLVNKNLPIRDRNGNPVTKEELKNNLYERIETLQLLEFKNSIDAILGKLEYSDEALYYFVLVSTYRLPDDLFEQSLKKLAVEQKLVTRIDGEYTHKPYSEPLIFNNIPQLAWDISPVVCDKSAAVPDLLEIPNDLLDIQPVDDWGLLSKEFREILQCEEILLSAKEGRPIEFFHLKSTEFWSYLSDLYRGNSSDLFQVNSMNLFYQSKPCRVEDWNLSTTKTILKKHIYLANLLNKARQHLKKLFIHNSNNAIRLMIQKYISDEEFIFWEYFEHMLNKKETDEFTFRHVVETLPKLEINDDNVDRFRLSDDVYEIVSGHYHVLNKLVEVMKKLNDYSPIILNEMSFIGSRACPSEYGLRMWRRLNVTIIRFIVKKAAGMLTFPDAELFELLVDAGDVKLIKDPSIWQRLNPLKIESSQCVDDRLANRLVDLIIGYRFFVNDKKHKLGNFNESTFAKSDIQDAEELELFAKTEKFEEIIEEILCDLDANQLSDRNDELNVCLKKMMDSLPTTSLVERYSVVVLKDSLRYLEFLKKFFTSGYIHLQNRNVFSNFTLTAFDHEKMHKLGFDREFLSTISCDARSTYEDFLLSVVPPEPMNVFASEGVSAIYSQLYTIMNMLQTALDAVHETHNCETFRHEPRLRYAFFHMNTTVFAIRKNIMTSVEAANETMKKTLDIDFSNDDRSAHDWLNVCYRAHRKFMREVANALMLPLNRGYTSRIIKMMVSSVALASKSCISGDAVSADQNYQKFLSHLTIFLDQCRTDRTQNNLYSSLELGEDSMDGKSAHSSYSDDLSCRSY